MIHVQFPASLPAQPLSFYLAAEEWVAAHMPAGDYMFTWIVEPTVIIGRNQVAELEVDISYCHDKGIDVFRRKSGGGCVYADPNNLMISYITPDRNVQRVFDSYLGQMAGTLRALGLDVTASGRNDLMLGDRKVSGNSFYLTPSRSIVHGTLLWKIDADTMKRAITPSRSKLMSHKVKSVRARVTGLADSLPGMTLGALSSYLTSSLCSRSVSLTPTDIEGIHRLRDLYHKPSWTFRHRQSASGTEAQRLPTRVIEGVGSFDITMLLDDGGLISDVDFFGDFFQLADLSPVIDRLRGSFLSEAAIAAALEGLDASRFIAGLSTARLISVLSAPTAYDTEISI